MIFIIRFLARGLGTEEFGAYSLARRIIANIVPFVVLSLDVALARYIAMTSDSKSQAAYIYSAVILTGAAFLLIIIIAVSASRQLSYLLFHSHEYLNLYYASFFLLGGYGILVITYAIFRGLQEFNIANSLQLCLMAIIPLIVSYSFSHKQNSALIMLLIGSGYYLSIIPLIILITKKKLPRIYYIKSSMKAILKYGLPRVPGGFAFAGLLTLGPFLAAYIGNLQNAGYFVIGQSVFRVLEAAIVGFGLVVLPKVSQLLAEDKVGFLKSKIEDILIMSFQLGLFITIHIFIWSKEIVLAWLGTDYMEAVPILKIIILSLGPYLGYVILRSIINAIEVRAINTFNLFVSLAFAAVISVISIFAGFGIAGLAVGTTLGFTALGILTSKYLIKRFQISLKNFLFQWVILLNLFFACTAIIVKYYISPYLSLSNQIIIGIIIEVLFFSCYLYFFYKKNCQWVLELKKRIFR
jgi:O-antigen/teichoic acid export membrane protein